MRCSGSVSFVLSVLTVTLVGAATLAESPVTIGASPAGAVEERPFPGCPDGSGRVVNFSCVPGAMAGVAGVYGGTTFGLVCNGDQSTTTICTEAGNNQWAVSGAATLKDGRQVRFAESGDSVTAVVRVGGGEVRLLIHP